MAQYSNLSRAGLSVEYLHTNSTTHEFLFGAIAELVDNSRDAEATTMSIFSMDRPNIRANRMICFLDNGCGMSSKEAMATVIFGYSNKRKNDKMIGQYGNGLKSGAMRIGKDLILFTKKAGILTVVFISRTFFDEEHLTEVVVPMPSFNAATKQPHFEGAETAEQLADAQAKHDIEMELIYKYSPFKTHSDLMDQFNMISGSKGSGTMICIFNLRMLVDTLELELDFKSHPHDIRISGVEPKDVVPEKFSLRSYLAVIYYDPRMKIYIQERKVRTRRIASGLFVPRQFKWSSARFKARAEKDVTEARHQARLGEKANEADIRCLEFEQLHGPSPADRNVRIELRKLQDERNQAKAEAKEKDDIAKEKARSLNDPKDLSFVFGMTLDRRDLDGLFVYNNGRLIKMYEKPLTKRPCRGVVGFLDVPYLVLEPTHNKQEFADEKEYRTLVRAMSDYMESYYTQTEKEYMKDGVEEFWKKFGYPDDDAEIPLDDDKFVKPRKQSVSLAIQCDQCLKWRDLAYQIRYDRNDPPDNWTCIDNPDKQFNKCTVPERTVVFQKGEFKKDELSVEQKQDQLRRDREKLSKKEAELKRAEALKTVNSAKDVTRLAQQSRTHRPQIETQPPAKRVRSTLSDDVMPDPRPIPTPVPRDTSPPLSTASVETAPRVTPQSAATSSNPIPVKTEGEQRRVNTNEPQRQQSATGTISGVPVTLPRSQMKLNKGEDGTIESRLRNVLTYFAPPHYVVTKEQITKMSANELMTIDLPDFFKTYSKDVASVFQTKEEERTAALLSKLRRDACALIRSVNPESTLDEGCDTVEVDRVLAVLATEVRNGADGAES